MKELDPALLTSIDSVIQVAQKLVEHEGPMKLCDVYEVGPGGVLKRQGGLDGRFVDHMDEETGICCEVLAWRGLSAYGSRAAQNYLSY